MNRACEPALSLQLWRFQKPPPPSPRWPTLHPQHTCLEAPLSLLMWGQQQGLRTCRSLRALPASPWTLRLPPKPWACPSSPFSSTSSFTSTTKVRSADAGTMTLVLNWIFRWIVVLHVYWPLFTQSQETVNTFPASFHHSKTVQPLLLC